MSKRDRNVAFKEEVEIVSDKKQRFSDRELPEESKSRFKAKHSLDSDEEDDRDDLEDTCLGDEDLAAQEDVTVQFEDGIQVTPFNLSEELEEGRFDSHGNYYLKKDPDSVQDNWLEGVDWKKLEEQREWSSDQMAVNDESNGEESLEQEVDKLTIYKQIVEILRPGETLPKAVRRLGGNKSQSASERWRKQKKKEKTSESEAKQPSSVDKVTLDRLTELADQLVATGDYSIYESTFEQLKFDISREEKAREPVDMFAELEGTSSTQNPGGGASSLDCDEVSWEYKWKNTDDEKIHGPFSSTQMSAWVDDGSFSEGVWVRKVGKVDGQFYTSKRIDFELYT